MSQFLLTYLNSKKVDAEREQKRIEISKKEWSLEKKAIKKENINKKRH